MKKNTLIYILSVIALSGILISCGGGAGAIDSPPNTPTITSSASALGAGQSVDLKGTATDPAGLALDYSWTFGDGQTGAGTNVSHRFTTAGNYSIVLTAKNSKGLTSAATSNVRVYAAPNTPTFSATATPATVTVGQTVTFLGSAVDPGGLALTYTWDYGDGTTGSGENTTHSYAAAGAYTATLISKNTFGLTSSATALVNVYGSPSVSSLNVSPATTAGVGKALTFTGAATDPGGFTLSYQWNYGDGSTGTGASSTHAYVAAGTYSVTLTVTSSIGLSSTKTTSVTVYPAPNAPTATISSSESDIAQTVTHTARGTDPNGLALTYSWAFGDGTTDVGASTTHAYAAAGAYTVTLTATNTVGLSATASLTQIISLATENRMIADCTGASCAATNASTYAGSGIGVWRYTNSRSTNANVNVNLSNIPAGKSVTLLYSNGASLASATKPSSGVLSSPLASPIPTATPYVSPSNAEIARQQHERGLHDDHHHSMLIKNAQIAAEVKKIKSSAPPSANASPLSVSTKPNPAPAVGASKVWKETYSYPTITNYAATARHVCTTATGRNVVIWVDAAATNSGKVTASNVTAFANAICGTSGGFSKTTDLIGDAWGSVSASLSGNYISDSAGLQDINIVIVDVPVSTGWAGYFWSVNNNLASKYSYSNEALVFFINANTVQFSQNYSISTLIHEFTHMVNFYQRAIVRNDVHDTWLEETSAMLSEDIIVPNLVTGYNKITDQRLPDYAATGGAINLIGWTTLSANSYNMGGAFGAYLNRRYGVQIYKRLITDCNTGAAAVTSWNCMNLLIQSLGGIGLQDEFARFGASTFSPMPSIGMPSAYGFPAKTDGAYSLAAVDLAANLSTRAVSILPTASSLSTFTATTHTYQKDTLAAGKTSYTRTGVVVPAKTTLIVIVK